MKQVMEKVKWILLGLWLDVLVFMPNIIETSLGESFDSLTLGMHLGIFGLYLVILVYLLSVVRKYHLMSLDKRLLDWKILGVGLLMMVGVRAMDYLGGFLLRLEKVSTTTNQASLSNDLQWTHPVNLFLMVVIVVPLAEEIIFRGLIFEKWLPNHQRLALIISVMVFAWVHSPERLAEWVIYGGSGIIFSLVYYKTRRLEYSLLAHMLSNGMVFLLNSMS